MRGYLHPWYFVADGAIRKCAATGKPFTVEDVEREAGPPPHYNMLGQAMKTAAEARIIKPTNRWVKSQKPSRRRARIAEWIGYGSPLPSPAPEPEPMQGALL